MKATLEFDLPDEKYEYSLAVNGDKCRSVINRIYELLRKRRKYEDQITINIEELESFMRYELADYDD